MFKLLKTKKRLIAVFALTAVLLCSIPAEAAAFYSYIYDSSENGTAVAAPDAAEPVRTVTGADIGTGSLNSPQDLFIKDDRLYIADSKNNRIVITDTAFSGGSVIDGFINAGKQDGFSEPAGICVTDDAIYVADTGNARLVKLSLSGELLMIVEAPEDEAFPKDFFFKPTKISVDGYGRIFVISSGYNMGLMQFDSEGTYLKSVGAPKVSMSVIEQFWKKISSKEQNARTQSYVPTEYSNLSISAEGFIYVTSESTSEDIEALRKLNAKGSDVLNRIGEPSGDTVKGGVTYKGNSAIVDFCELDEGNFAILDRKRSRVFAYNGNCELLYVFAGPGTYNGGMSVPTSMVYSDNKYYIADSGKNAICVYELTEYGVLFNKVAKARNDIDFETEESLWDEIICRNANCTLAMRGLGNAAYKRHDMKGAMRYYRMAEDRENYSKAYSFVRREWIESNIMLIAAAVVLLVVLMFTIGRLKRKYLSNVSRTSLIGQLRYCSYVSYHPLDGYWVLKREKRGSVKVALLMLLAAVAVLTASNLFTGFIFNRNDLQTYNMLGNAAFMVGAVLLWCIAQWCVTSLMEGEGKFTDILIATCYALRPYVVVNIFAILLSRVLLVAEGDFYYVLTAIALLWTLMLLVSGVMQTHNYTMTKTLLVIVIVLVVILLIVFIGMLVMALCQQLTAFIKDIITEVTLRI